MPTIASISLCSALGVFYFKGVGFADIAYATRRSVSTLTAALDNAKKSILSRITGLEKTFESRSDQIENKIVDEAHIIRQKIRALHQDQKNMGSEVSDIHKKVTNVELLTMLSSRGVSLLCTTLDKPTSKLNSKYINY